jgi:hypothetical protein
MSRARRIADNLTCPLGAENSTRLDGMEDSIHRIDIKVNELYDKFTKNGFDEWRIRMDINSQKMSEHIETRYNSRKDFYYNLKQLVIAPLISVLTMLLGAYLLGVFDLGPKEKEPKKEVPIEYRIDKSQG